ncbi:MAG: type I restriction endonuclease subunit R [Alphaproteobacteria bacterium]|nr:MAG: type I restriction endonuclease subunit R [Alphaproteobacteria bacterium]
MALIDTLFAEYEALKEANSPYLPIVAFTGEHEHGGAKVTEASLNGFPSGSIEEQFQEDPYRILVCADKFQTGYDEPLLHTMYVDKTLAGIKAVQTLSRLNRAHAKKRDTFILDFINDPDVIQASFQEYYQTTILSGETDPNRLHDLVNTLDSAQVYTAAQVDDLVERYLSGASRETLDPILDTCVVVYNNTLDEKGQVEFKGTAKAFLRNYNFLSAILPYSLPEWEKLSVFLTFLVPKLPAPQEEDLAQGILESIDMDSYRAEKNATLAITLSAENASLDPSEVGGSGHKPEPELDRLSNIVQQFNALFSGSFPFKDADKVLKMITEEIPAKVEANKNYLNAMQNSDRENARQQHDRALELFLISLIKDDTEFYKLFKSNPEFQRFVSQTSFESTYHPPKK